MKKVIEESVVISATPAKIWGILTDFDNYPNWNPFVRFIRGHVAIGEKISVQISPPNSAAMTFRPRVLEFTPNRKLCWLGKVLFQGLFDGEHQFELIENNNGTTTFIQSEKFSGILVRFFLPKTTADGFRKMNGKLKDLAEN
ncbi:hypothetical protein FACS1894181_06760 [Bacteroidia bacterium]|nr:hypothetical protein FACS1894181_06760 [Bacteroidia bacterium]